MTDEQKFSFDDECFRLVKHFCPHASNAVCNELAQAIQDLVENSRASSEEERYLGT